MNHFYNPPPSCQIPNLSGKWEALFGRRRQGFFVEVGGYDGESFSNTCFLADLGWGGLYIEPVVEFAAKCRDRHIRNSNVKVVEVAISNKPGEADIYIGDTLTTLSDAQVRDYNKIPWAAGLHKGEKRISKLSTLDEVLEDNSVRNDFDLLVVDVEGFEREVFEGFSLEVYSPTVVVVELEDDHPDFRENSHTLESASYIRERLLESGYIEYYRDQINTIFVLSTRYSHIPCEIECVDPVVTIGMPTRNGAKTIRRALCSIASQSYRSFALVVSDNNSTDGTAEILQEYISHFPNLKIVRQSQTISAYANFIKVTENCTTKYFVFLADDDFWEPLYLEKCIAQLDSDTDAVSAFSMFRVYYHFVDRYSTTEIYEDSKSSDKYARVLARTQNMAACAFYGVHRTAQFIPALMEVGAFDFSDVAVTIWLASKGKLINIPFDLYRSGVADESKTTRRSLDGGQIRYKPFALFLIKFSFLNFSFFEAVKLVPRLLQALDAVRRHHSSIRGREKVSFDSSILLSRDQIL